MKYDIKYIVERRDNQGNFHLIQYSENLWNKMFAKATSSKDLDLYFKHVTTLIKQENHNLFSEFSGISKDPVEKQIMKSFDRYKLGKEDFNPLSKYFISQIHNGYNSFGYQSFDNIIKHLQNSQDPYLESYTHLLIKSTDYFSTLKPMHSVTHRGIEKRLDELVSNHHYLELLGGNFDSQDLENFRMIVYYDG